jgi:hypothetical protein
MKSASRNNAKKLSAIDATCETIEVGTRSLIELNSEVAPVV